MPRINLGEHEDDYLEKGLEFRIEIPKINVKDFAMIVLTLTNMRSSASVYGVFDFRTYTESNLLSVYMKGEDKEKASQVLDYVMKVNTDDVEYTIEFVNEIEIVNIWLCELEDKGLIKNSFDTFVKGSI